MLKIKPNKTKIKAFNNKYAKLNNQVVMKKSPWPKIIFSLILTVAIIFIFYLTKPIQHGWSWKLYSHSLKNFFNFSSFYTGASNITIWDTVNLSFALLLKTIGYSALGTMIGVVCSLPLAFISSRNIVKKWWIFQPFRVVMSLIRSIPPLIVAFLMFNIFSATLSATVTIAIFVTTIMTKWMFEEIDTIDISTYHALQAFGNSKYRAIMSGVVPIIMKKIVSYSLYSFEIVVRFATILGVVGIATIGVLLKDNYSPIAKWGHMSIVLAMLIFAIVIIEVFSVLFKKYILNYNPKRQKLDSSSTLKDQKLYVLRNKPKIWIAKLIIGIVFIFILIYGISQTEWAIASPYKLNVFKNNVGKLFRPEWSYIVNMNTGVNAIQLGLQAVFVAITSVVIGVICGTIFGTLASRNITGVYVSWFFKVLLVTVRSVPAFVFAITFLLLTPPDGLFAGVLALGINSIGMLGKLTYEKMESVDMGKRVAIDVTGATKFQSFLSTIWIEAIPTVLSNALYRIEINFKSTIVIGAVGASAFGFQVGIYAADPRNYSALSAYLLVIIVIVLTLEQISNLGRKKLMKGYFFQKNNWIYKRIRHAQIKSSYIYAKALNLKFSKSSNWVKYNNYVGKRTIKSSNENIFTQTKQEVEVTLKNNIDFFTNKMENERIKKLKLQNKLLIKLKKELLNTKNSKNIKQDIKEVNNTIKIINKKNTKRILSLSYQKLYAV